MFYRLCFKDYHSLLPFPVLGVASHAPDLVKAQLVGLRNRLREASAYACRSLALPEHSAYRLPVLCADTLRLERLSHGENKWVVLPFGGPPFRRRRGPGEGLPGRDFAILAYVDELTLCQIWLFI